MPADEAIKRLEVDVSVGLSSDEVQKRRDRFGLNQITPKKGTPIWLRFLLQFHQPLIYILLAATATTLFLKEASMSKAIKKYLLIALRLFTLYVLSTINQGKKDGACCPFSFKQNNNNQNVGTNE